ncbi:helix-turn-helix transcriptional regulator [Streptomyces sp. NPDC004457]|uniref:helix-turn-helix transcriptional regulator n=1 Tax=Streptomyces spinosus TaxID=2872623 RepID=UPI001CED6AE5|nr:helix-turn-helix transcriptional regulator [Streptomyces spinosus]
MTTSLKPVGDARRREELRLFLRTRRERLAPQDVGLPPGARRRTPGLRREEVAMLAGIGASWYTWLEQGRDIKVSEQVLDAISRTLRLDAAERDHLYRLVGLNPPRHTAGDPGDISRLTSLLEGWMPSPAYAIDRCWNIVGTNRAAELVFGFREGDTNCLMAFFTNPAFRARHRYWADIAPGLVSEFRRDAARYPDDPEFTRISEHLAGCSPEFAELWSRYEIRSTNQGVKAIDHPRAGCLIFDHSVLEVPDRPGVRLMLHTAQAGTDTAERVRELLDRDARKGRISLVEAG